MAKCIFTGGFKVANAAVALLTALMLLTSCSTDSKDGSDRDDHEGNDGAVLPVNGGLPTEVGPNPGDVPVAVVPAWDVIQLMVKIDPLEPYDERFLDDWRFQIVNIDDEARPSGPVYYGESGPDGTAAVGLPAYMFQLPLVINAYNDAYPLLERERRRHHRDGGHGDSEERELYPCRYGECRGDFVGGRELDEDEGDHEASLVGTSCDEGGCDNRRRKEEFECRHFEIFVPAGCYDKAVWLLGPLENALWDYYGEADELRAEAWNSSQVDCATWLANMQLLIQTDKVNEELHEIAENGNSNFDIEVLIDAFQENQNFLTPTRPPICMAERRHVGGGLEEGRVLDRDDFPVNIDDGHFPFGDEADDADPHGPDPILVDEDGIVSNLCGLDLHGRLRVNGARFEPTRFFTLESDEDFLGTVHKQDETVDDINVRLINVRLGNGRPLENDVYDDACALTELVEFTNIDDGDQDILDNTGVTFDDLFIRGDDDTRVWLSSDGDNVINDDDTWAILYSGDEHCRERVLAVELLGHRIGDFRDVLYMERRDNPEVGDNDGEDLFIGLRADYRLEEETIDGQLGYMGYTLSFWDGSTQEGLENVRTQIAVCYEAADVWARQFFSTVDFQERRGENCDCVDDCCRIEKTICPLRAAEMAVRSQCFSNSRSNSRWQTQDVGFWSMNNTHGVHANVVVNPGWLAPNMDFEIYIQKFDEAVFKGPRTVVTSDCFGQIMTALPTLVEGDRVLIKSQDACCSDYDVVLPCVPEFTGFAGAPLVPYVPQIVGPAAPVATPIVATPVQPGAAGPVAGPGPGAGAGPGAAPATGPGHEAAPAPGGPDMNTFPPTPGVNPAA